MDKVIKNSPYLLLVLATMLWGGNFVIGRAVVEQIPPFTLAFLRWLTAVCIFVPLVWRDIVDNRELLQKHWLPLTLMGLTGVASFNTLLYVGLHYTTSINASLVNTTAPVIIAILSYFILKEHLLKNHYLGIVLSLSGVLLIFSQGSLEILLTLSFNPGDIIMFIAVIIWGLYSIVVRQNSKRLPPYSSLAISMIIGVLFLLPFFLWEQLISGEQIIWSPSSVAAIGYVGIFASIVSFLSWNKAVGKIGPGKAGVFLSLIPVFTTIFAIIFIGETLMWYQLVGGLLAIGGIYLSTRPQVK